MQYDYGGGFSYSPNEYYEHLRQQQKNERKGLFKNASFLGIILLGYVYLNDVFKELFYILTYYKCENKWLFDVDKVVEYLRENQMELVSTSSYNMTLNLFVTLSSLAVVLIVSIAVMKVNVFTLMKPDKEKVKIGAKWTPFAVTVNVLVSIIAMLVVRSMSQSGVTVPEADFTIKQPSTAAIVMQFLYVCALGPVIEEILYRGFVIKLISPYSKMAAVLFSALSFGLMHGNVSQAIAAGLTGFFYALIAVNSGSLVPTVVIHIVNNTVVSLNDFGEAVNMKDKFTTLYLAILIVFMFMGFYMTFVNLSQLFKDVKYSEPQRSLPKRSVYIGVFVNAFVLLYFAKLVGDILKYFIYANR